MASEDDDNLAALIAGGGATGGETAAPAGDDAGASAAAAAEPEPDEAAITDEGKAATELDAQYQFRFEQAQRHSKNRDFEQAVSILEDLLPECAGRYGQLCPLLARMYYAYGHALLRVAESKADALVGDKAGDDEDDDDDDDDEEEGGDGGGASSSSPAAAAAAEEDIAGEDGADGDADDVQVAFENLDVARIIFGKMPPTPETELALAKVRLRLGDAASEGERFSDALDEYKHALLLFTKHLPPHDRWLNDALYSIGTTHIQLAQSKTASEGERRAHLAQALVNLQAAAEVLALLMRHVGGAAGNAEFVAGLDAELRAGALTRTYGPGVHTTAVPGAEADSAAAVGVGSGGEGAGAGAGAGAGSSSSSAAAAAAPLAEPEIRVFSSLYVKFGKALPQPEGAAGSNPAADADAAKEHAAAVAVETEAAAAVAAAAAAGADGGSGSSSSAAAASSSSSAAAAAAPGQAAGVVGSDVTVTDLPELCEIADGILQKMWEIQADLGTDVGSILAQVQGASASVSTGGGITTTGFPAPLLGAGAGAGAGSSGGEVTAFGFGDAAAAAAPAVTLAARRKAPAPAAASEAAAAPAAEAGAKRPRDDEPSAAEPSAKEARTEE